MFAVKRIFRYLKGRPKLGLWYPKDSPFILEAFSDSDYCSAAFKQEIHNKRLSISWFKTKIHVDNESVICAVKNLVYHSKIKHIEIRHHFIRDSYEKRLIEMVKIHSDNNVADLLTKAFDNDGNADFHQILDFLTSCSNDFALTAVVVSKSSVRRDLHLNSEDVITFNDIYETPKPTKGFYKYEEARKRIFRQSHTIVSKYVGSSIVVGEGSEQPTEPQPTSSTAPQEILTQVATTTASQPPKDPNTYRRTKRGRNTKVPQFGGYPKKVGDEAINEEILDAALLNSKAFRVYNIRTRKVEENLHVRFLEDKPIIAGRDGNGSGVGPKWLFDIDVLTESMNYVPVLHEQTLMILQKDDDSEIDNQERPEKSAQDVNTAGASIKIASTNDNTGSLNINTEVNMSNITTTYPVSSTPNTRIHKDHSLAQMIGDIQSSEEPKKVIQALNDPSWIEAMQEELLQFKLQQVWTLVDLPYGKRAIRGIVIRNKARLVAQGYTQEEGIDYNEFFAPVAKIEAIRLFLAYASFKGFVVYQMDVKSAFLYGKIEEEVYVCQPLGFENPEFPDKVYKVEKALYGLHQASRAWYETLSTYLLDNGFQRGQINKTLFFKKIKGELTFFLGLQMKQKNDGIFISQDKYVEEIFKKFDFSTVKTVSTPMETSKPLLKHAEAENVDAHLYRSMIGSLMYLTTSRPDIMFAFCACTRFQVTHKVSHLHVVKWIFRYLKGQPKLGLWYPRDSPFDLEAFSDSDYAGASLDRKSTTGVVAKSTTEAEYVAAANCCGQVLWIQNQMLDYGFNFMNTKIYIDNESTICIVKNPMFHSKTKHIEIRHHFIRDSYKKKLIQVIKIHTDHNVADLLTKAFDVSRFNFLIARTGLLNL
ncbi:putative ribonuclease H-like domain-containing protein [Tanacetum coccineum]